MTDSPVRPSGSLAAPVAAPSAAAASAAPAAPITSTLTSGLNSTGPNAIIPGTALTDDPLWFKDAVIYEIHIRAFQDSNGDGIGDINGLIERLDYLSDLGITALWLLPFYPSPLKDGGYDIADYTDVHEHYGTRG